MSKRRHSTYTETIIEGIVVTIKCQVCGLDPRFRIFEGIQRKTLIIYPHKCIDNSELK